LGKGLEEWVIDIEPRLVEYMDKLKVRGEPGRFLPCLEGMTPLGERIALGFSCFALKIHYMLGLWDRLPEKDKLAWISFINSYQVDGNPYGEKFGRNAFIDPPVYDHLKRRKRRFKHVVRDYISRKRITPLQLTIIAETKQAIATLKEAGGRPERAYGGFPVSAGGVEKYLQRFDWSRPWSSGAQFAAICVFIKSEGPEIMQPGEVGRLSDACYRFLEKVTDAESGAYFAGKPPEHGELINGAMKVLTGLDWLEAPIHYPEKLIDTCLERVPKSEGCHLVDAVYVLYRCLQQTEYRKRDIQEYCGNIVPMIQKHFVERDGGFSYNLESSQTVYYGVPITRGLPVADIHGTILLTWALAMILKIMDIDSPGWKALKP